MKSVHFVPVSLVVLLCSANANATFSVGLDIIDPAIGTSSAPSWAEDITNLVAVDSNNVSPNYGSFSMLSGSSAPGKFFQNGIFSNSVPVPGNHPDYWEWKDAIGATPGNWYWHSADTVSTTNSSWRSEANLNKMLGNQAKDIDYEYFAKNNTSTTQTYTFSVVEDINPAIANPTSVFNQFTAHFTNTSNSFHFAPTSGNGKAQHFLLSTDKITWVETGIEVGGKYDNPSNLNPTESLTGVGPSGGPWKYMKLSTSFTLSGNKDSAALVGYASISAVPEPESYAMLLAGLGMIGFMIRRRGRQQA